MKTGFLPFIDLFCGAGGLSAGFEMAGFESVFANDIDEYACETYATNHRKSHVFSEDVKEINRDLIFDNSSTDSIQLIIGGPNCQGVSLRGKRDPNDPKNQMFYHFLRLVKEIKPAWFVMENVPGLLHRHNRELVSDIFKSFDDCGYDCGGEILSAADYGVPQLRYRFVLIGNRTGAPILFPNPTHRMPTFDDREEFADDVGLLEWNTALEAIGDLPKIVNGGGSDFYKYKDDIELGNFLTYCQKDSSGIYNHRCHKTPAHNIALIKHVRQGGNWRDIPEKLRPERFQRVALKDHTTTYGRLQWGMPSRTITTYFNNISSGAFVHPEQHRGISVREGARFQSFPDAFKFCGPLSRQYRQIGNAVPPLMASRVAEVINKQMLGKTIDPNEVHSASVTFDKTQNSISINRPLQGMRFNLDKHLVRRAS